MIFQNNVLPWKYLFPLVTKRTRGHLEASKSQIEDWVRSKLQQCQKWVSISLPEPITHKPTDGVYLTSPSYAVTLSNHRFCHNWTRVKLEMECVSGVNGLRWLHRIKLTQISSILLHRPKSTIYSKRNAHQHKTARRTCPTDSSQHSARRLSDNASRSPITEPRTRLCESSSTENIIPEKEIKRLTWGWITWADLISENSWSGVDDM